MAKEQDQDRYFDIDELLRMTPTQMLGRIGQLNDDLRTAQGHHETKKQEAKAAKDAIKDVEGRLAEIMKIIPRDFLGANAGSDETIEQIMLRKGIPLPEGSKNAEKED